MAEPTAIYVIDGNDISGYATPDDAAASIEGYDAADLQYVGVDGSVWRAAVEGPKWGPVTLHRTLDKRPDLVARLRASGHAMTDD